MKGEILLYIPINITQSLLKKQFPGLNVLQPTVYQLRSQTGESLKDEVNQMQIINCRGNHWIVASSIGCIKDSVNIYDSLCTSLDETTKVTVSSLFGLCINMHMQPLEWQVGGTYRAIASGPAGPTLVGPLFGSKMGVCLDDSYACTHALAVVAIFYSVDCGYGGVPH